MSLPRGTPPDALLFKRKDDDDWFIKRLIGVGYTREEAVKMLETDYADAAEEDGYDGP